ncbi:MAG: hypothetical protein LBM98_01450 [Oscillospiraceae bacterium]|nr:hypothetical protein [Oscillospiraceae bacterium]
MRYVGRYRCEAIQCRGRNIRTTYRRILRQPWIASPHIICTYRKCGGGFAMTGEGASLIRGLDGGYAIRAGQGALPLQSLNVFCPFPIQTDKPRYPISTTAASSSNSSSFSFAILS